MQISVGFCPYSCISIKFMWFIILVSNQSAEENNSAHQKFVPNIFLLNSLYTFSLSINIRKTSISIAHRILHIKWLFHTYYYTILIFNILNYLFSKTIKKVDILKIFIETNPTFYVIHTYML